MVLELIASAVQQCKKATPVKKTIRHYMPLSPEKYERRYNQFVILMKPECFSSENVHYLTIVKMLLSKFTDYGVLIDAIYAMNGEYLKEKRIMEDQYKVLNRGAREGLNGIPLPLRESISKEFGDTKIMGAYPFLNENPDISCVELEKLSHESGSIKKGNGTYLFYYEKKDTVIVNAFHPHQLEHFTKIGAVMLVFICSSSRKYSTIVQDMVGHFNPERANVGSLRHYIFSNRAELGLKEVGIFYNGFHVSPSPLEGMFAVLRYGTDVNNMPIRLNNTILGNLLIKHGYEEKDIYAIRENPYISVSGISKTFFDMAEENRDDLSFMFTKSNSIIRELRKNVFD